MAQFASTLYPQTNPTNPILLAFRDDPDVESWAGASFAADAFGGYQLWEHPKNRFHAFTKASESQISHAIEVIHRLSRLASLSG